MFRSTLIATAIAFFTFTGTLASPLAPRGTNCRPNFEGTDVSVINNAVEWGFVASTPSLGDSVVNAVASTSQAEFRFEFSGAPTNTYHIKYVFITVAGHGLL
jgi:hypothetical protein